MIDKAIELEPVGKPAEPSVPVPKALGDLLGQFDGRAIILGAEFVSKHPSPWAVAGRDRIEMFYGYATDDNFGIRNNIETFRDQLPDGFVPIGDAGGGNQICAAPDGTVWFWDHEHESGDGLSLVHDSVEGFLRALIPLTDDGDDDDDDHDVIFVPNRDKMPEPPGGWDSVL